MSKKKPETAPTATDRANLGDYVLWTPDFDTPAANGNLACVTEANGKTSSVGLAIFAPGSRTLMPKSSVPHVSEGPERIANIGEGCWRALPASALTKDAWEWMSAKLDDTVNRIDELSHQLKAVRGQLLTAQRKLKLEPKADPEAEPPTEGSATE